MNSYARQQNAAYRRQAADMSATPDQRIADLEAQVTRLEYRLQVAHERITELESADGASDPSPLPAQRGGDGGGDVHWLTLAEAAEKFGVDASTVWRALNGQSPRFISGPVIKLGNRRWLLADTCTLSPRARRGRN